MEIPWGYPLIRSRVMLLTQVNILFARVAQMTLLIFPHTIAMLQYTQQNSLSVKE